MQNLGAVSESCVVGETNKTVSLSSAVATATAAAAPVAISNVSTGAINTPHPSTMKSSNVSVTNEKVITRRANLSAVETDFFEMIEVNLLKFDVLRDSERTVSTKEEGEPSSVGFHSLTIKSKLEAE